MGAAAPPGRVERSDELLRLGRLRPQARGLLRERPRVLRTAAGREHRAEEVVRLVVVRALREGVPKGPLGPVRVAGEEQRPAVVRAQRRQLRVLLERAREALDGLGVVTGHERGRAEEVLGLGRVAVPHQGLDEPLAFLHLAVPHEGHAQHVRDRAVVGPGGGERPQQLLDGGGLAELQPAVGQEQGRAHVVRLLRVQGLQLFGRARQVGRLVVREGEVVADATVGRRDGERGAIGLDRLLVAAERRERRTEVRPRLGRGPEAQALAVRRDRALEVAGLVQGERPGEQRRAHPRPEGRRRRPPRPAAPPRGARGRTRALRALPTGSCPDAGCARRTTARW